MKQIFTLLIASCSLVSCNLYKNYERPEIAERSTQNLFRDAIASDTASFGNMPWREVFTDPQLQTLIGKALTQNTDMKKADLTIEKARIPLTLSKLAYLPSMALAPQGSISSFDGSKATKTYTLPLSVSWEIGSWGNLRNNLKKAGVLEMQAKAGKQATQTAIISAVANLYFTLQMLDAQLQTTNETIVLWKKNVETMEAMQVAAMTTNAAVAQTKANYYELLTTVPTLENSIRQAENALCMLLNEAPHAISRSAFNADCFPQTLSAGVPAQLLSNRPDVRLAELQLASAFYDTNIARSAFYPSLTISGLAGWTNSAGSAVINPAKFIAQAAASVVQPLFAQGKIRGNLQLAKLTEEELTLDFRQTLLTAGQEVSDALSSYQTAIRKQESREKEVEQLQTALSKTEDLFKYTNSTTYLEKLTAQQSLLNAQLSLISDKYARVQAAISLYQALGGGRN
ncbi:MAG: efflux transporter outer membrane subunit [Alloprevotella sp.]